MATTTSCWPGVSRAIRAVAWARLGCVDLVDAVDAVDAVDVAGAVVVPGADEPVAALVLAYALGADGKSCDGEPFCAPSCPAPVVVVLHPAASSTTPNTPATATDIRTTQRIGMAPSPGPCARSVCRTVG